MKDFKDYKLSEEVLRALSVLGYSSPTEVQSAVIEELLDYENVIVKSQTGSGKTAAFAIPLVENIDWNNRKPQVLVLAPTRELALQIQEDMFNIGRFKRIKVEAIYGRSSFEAQEKALRGMVHAIVATPGRLIDHMKRRTIDLSQVTTLIIDESDEMLAMGFIDQIESILRKIPRNANIGLFSATMPQAISDLGNRIMNGAVHIEVENVNQVEDRVLQHVYKVEDKDKLKALKGLIVVENPNSCILFCNTKALVEAVADLLWDMDVEVHTLHGDMEQRDRTKVITQFKRGQFRYLVATDVAARGLDIADVQLVINVDVPENSESYVHRIGRCARVDKEGKAITLVSDYGMRYLEVILEETDNKIQMMELPSPSFINSKVNAFTSKIKRQPKLIKEKGFDFKEEIMKIHINAGKKTKMRPGDVVGAICSIDGISMDDIGIISVLDVSTFVEILNNKGPQVLKALQDKAIKGRIRNVNRANQSEYERQLLEQNK